MNESFFQPIPADPLPLLADWFEFARLNSRTPNWNTMHLATVDAEGWPSVRPVLFKDYDPATGSVTFFTNYRSAKASDLEANPRVAASMHWDQIERVVRIQGTVAKASAAVSDAYFATRPRESRIGAWASDQSRPLDSWETFLRRIEETARRYEGVEVPRPPHWGGYVIAPRRIEFWIGRPGRLHERVVYSRREHDSAWEAMRLFP